MTIRVRAATSKAAWATAAAAFLIVSPRIDARAARQAAPAVPAPAAAAAPMAARPTTSTAQNSPAASALPRVELTAGRSTVLSTDFDVTRIAVTNPAVADAVVVSPREVLIDGKTPGTVSLILWSASSHIQYDVVIDPPVTPLQEELSELFPGENIHVAIDDEATTLWGNVSNTATMLKAGEIAEKTSSKNKVINLLQVPGGAESQQVMLQVRFAEVNRQALTEAGVSFFTSAAGEKNWVAQSSTEQYPTAAFQSDGTTTFSDLLNLFVFNTKYNVGALLKALQTKGLLQSLAEPNLIAYNGQEASFLAGGEVPVPVAQGAVGAAAITIIYKEFGIRLTFTPVIAGDLIRLHVKPEVSSLDFADGVTLNGFRVPALTTRRAETDVELRDGQSFAMAGLMDNLSQSTREAIPILGSLPIIGSLFKSESVNRTQTELMVLITPHLVRPLSPDEVPPLPTDLKQFLPEETGVGAQLQGGGGPVDAPPLTPAPRGGSR